MKSSIVESGFAKYLQNRFYFFKKLAKKVEICYNRYMDGFKKPKNIENRVKIPDFILSIRIANPYKLLIYE